MAKGSSKDSLSPRIANRKAFHDYHIHEKLECGIMLAGSEVKAVRHGRVSLAEAFARIEPATMELWLYNMDVGVYENAGAAAHEPKRKRKLLARRRQIQDLFNQTASKGMTLVPLALYFNSRGIAKIELGVGSGKGEFDKRQSLKKKEARRAMDQAMSRKRIG